MQCRRCGSKKLRLSHFYFHDLIRMLLLRYPLRCRDCRARYYVGFATAYKVLRGSDLHRQESVSAGR